MEANKITWTKPSGLKITTNDKKETIEYCESLGWKRDDAVKEKKPRKTKASKTPIVTDTECDIDVSDEIVEAGIRVIPDLEQ